MRISWLYMRSRLAVHTGAILTMVALTTWAVAPWALSRPLANPALVPVLTLAPLVSACALGASTRSPFGDAERSVARPLSALRLGHLVGLLVWAALALFLVSLPWNYDAARILVRNLAGLSGLAFIAARLLGGHLSWTLPLAFAVIAPVAGGGARNGGLALWAWMGRPPTDLTSILIALALLTVGLAVVCSAGSRETVGAAE